MDDAVALVIAVPVMALVLWALAFAGDLSNSEARTTVAAEAAAQAAARGEGAGADDTAARVALGATLSACERTTTRTEPRSVDGTALITVVCDVPGPIAGNRVCVTAYAEARTAVSDHVRVACPRR